MATMTVRDRQTVWPKLVLAAVLKAEIERLGITAYKLASLAGLPQTTAQNVIGGDVMPRLDTAMKLEAGLGRPTGWLSQELRRQLQETPAA